MMGPMLVLGAILAWPSVAHAAGGDSAERAAQAQAACLSGDYTKGVAILAELYVKTRNATYIFNQGRCFEQNGRYEEAIVRFREFQRKNAIAGRAPDRTAQEHINDCQALIDKNKTATPTSPPPLPPVPQAPGMEPAASISPPVAPAEAKPAGVDVQPEVLGTAPPGDSAGAGLGLRIAGIAAAVVGIGGIATGVALNVKANNLAKDLESANNSKETLYRRSKESSRSSYETWGWVAYGTGAACLAGGAVLYFLGHRQTQPRAAFVPTVADGHVGAVLQGAF